MLCGGRPAGLPFFSGSGPAARRRSRRRRRTGRPRRPARPGARGARRRRRAAEALEPHRVTSSPRALVARRRCCGRLSAPRSAGGRILGDFTELHVEVGPGGARPVPPVTAPDSHERPRVPSAYACPRGVALPCRAAARAASHVSRSASVAFSTASAQNARRSRSYSSSVSGVWYFRANSRCLKRSP